MILLWLVIVDDVKGITEGVPLPKQTAHLCQSLLWSHTASIQVKEQEHIHAML